MRSISTDQGSVQWRCQWRWWGIPYSPVGGWLRRLPAADISQTSLPTASAMRCGEVEVDITMSTWVVSAKAASRSEEHTSELQSLMRISYAAFCLKKIN